MGHLAAGGHIGPYEVIGPLGSGGMGEVYRGRDARLCRQVAIKILPQGAALDPDRLARFEREAKVLASLAHPNILAIYEFGAEAGVPYAVTELVEGETLREQITRERLSKARAIEIAATIADALAAAHARHVVHRDLKPENVLIATDGRVKVVDFGLAAVEGVLPDAETKALTAPGVILGTPGYMAPEQVRGEPTDQRADIFSLGCIAYELLNGRPAFHRSSVAETLTAILRDPAPPFSVAAPGGRDIERVIGRCLEKHADQRFQSASDLAFALREHQPDREPPRDAAGGVTPQSDPRPSIAVLPFANLSADPEQEYFCDGMAEEIINALVHVEGLRVLARTSSFAFKGRHMDIHEIGAQLGARMIVEGSVRRSGDRLRITTQLIDTRDGGHLWSERYDRPLTDVFAIQDEIALSVVDNLKVRLLAGERAAMARRPAINLVAYETYLKGLFHWNALSPEGFVASQAEFEEAIRLDPDLAAAYVFLAQAYASEAFWADAEPLPAAARAFPLVEKALVLQPDCAEAHTGRGILSGCFQYDWNRAEHCFRTGLRLGPNLAFAHLHLGGMFAILQRLDEAILETRLTLQLDPVSPTTSAWAAFWMACSGAYEEGREHLENVAAKNPSYWMPWWELSMLYSRLGRFTEAREHAERAVELSGGATLALSVLGAIWYLNGDAARGDDISEQLRLRALHHYISPTAVAWLYLARGDVETGVAAVRRAIQMHDPLVPFWRMSLGPLVSDDSRIDAALQSIGL